MAGANIGDAAKGAACPRRGRARAVGTSGWKCPEPGIVVKRKRIGVLRRPASRAVRLMEAGWRDPTVVPSVMLLSRLPVERRTDGGRRSVDRRPLELRVDR